ncbi:hypothetical protein [Xanthomonas translucens]|uniref:hypothetical protein n=1 Tax=Xanthomonas campestris pv. translucens TaxID=343 RepID=UPI0010085E3C|nr:hypothetical protein [Xanthomonas translucens]UKE57725.1 hypothetical protein KFS86_17225 [Xanthomonas translucens pv. hordei]WIH00733.1 hypothetical protein KFS83_17225 [Xanthomonas translucens pv. hordei]
MEISDETIKGSLRLIGDDDLLKRWSKGHFNEQALPIAQAELERRGLDVSENAVARMKIREEEDNIAIRRCQKSTAKRFVLRLFSGILGTAITAIAEFLVAAR